MLPLMGYERRSRILELTQSPPHGTDDGPLCSRVAIPHRVTKWPARLWRVQDALIFDQSPKVETPSPLLPPLTVEEKGPKDNDSVATLPVYCYGNGMPIYFPFYTTTKEWVSCEAWAYERLRLKGLLSTTLKL